MDNKIDKNREYMLTTNKIKQHWMLDPRWTVNDKVEQFRGIIKLYEREKKIIRNDTKTTKQQNIKQLHGLRDDIKKKRDDLNRSIRSGHSTLRQTLADYRPLQLKYQNQDASKVVDDLKQIIYGKKKSYDNLIFKRKQQTSILKELKLKLADLEDQANMEYPLEQKAQMIAGQIQDTKLKSDVASTIQRNFKNILQTMKKDAIYFDGILLSLEKDARQQGRCLYRTTQMGQLATEYLDDRIRDYKVLERAIMTSMQERQKNIKEIRHHVKETTNCLKQLLSKDKDTELTKHLSPAASEIQLHSNIESIESILKFIQNTTYVSQFNEIIPRMQDQHAQYTRLFKIANDFSNLRDTMIKKRNHAQLMYDTLSTAIADTTYQYIEQKKIDAKLFEEYKIRLKEIEKEYSEMGDMYLNIRVSLHQLHQRTECVCPTSEEQKAECKNLDDGALPERPITNVNTLLQILNGRYQLLMNNYIELDESQKLSAMALYQQALMDAYYKAHIDEFDRVMDETSLVTDIELDDPTIPSREDIKKRSARIVLVCAQKDDDQPITLLPLRGKTYY